jgi:hypothetical protein
VTLCRHFRFPLISTPTPPCKCGQPLDVYGDHLFACHRLSKSRAHNKIRDCLFYILKEIAPLANLIRTPHCVGIETKGLLPQFPTHRPADVALKLHPHYADRLHPSPLTLAAIDCTLIPLLEESAPPPLVPPPPPLPPEPDPTIPTPIPPDPSSSSLRKHHFRYEFNKFRGRTRTNSHGQHIWGPDVINDCNQQKILLIPFTIDPNGMLGPTAQYFLFGSPLDTDFPEQSYQSLTPPSRIALDSTRGKYGIQSILPLANQAWHSKHPDPKSPSWFGATYHTPTPQRWAQFILGLTTAKTFADHFLESYDVIKSHSLFISTHPPTTVLGSNSRSYYSSVRTSSSPSLT